MFEDYPDVVRVKDLCKMLSIGRNKAYELLNDGLIFSVYIGRIYRIPKKEIIRYLTADKNNALSR